MLRIIQQKLYQSLVSYLVEPNGRSASFVQPLELRDAGERLLPGDIILVLGRTRFSSIVCRLTQSRWSHVAIYVGPDPHGDCIVEADVEKGVRRIGFAQLDARSVCVLRHRAMTEAHRASLVAFLDKIVGHPYSTDHALAMCCLLVGGPRLGGYLHERMQRGQIPAEFICSSLVAYAFATAGVPLDIPQSARSRKRHNAPPQLPHTLVVPGDFALVPGLESIFDSRQVQAGTATARIASPSPLTT